MADNSLLADSRADRGTRPAGRLRRAGKVPAVLYGLGTDTLTVTVPERELAHILASETGANTLITLQLDGEEHLALARQIQRHPTRGSVLHVDFIRVRRDVAVAAEVPVHLTGEPAGVLDGGILEQLVFSLSIEAKPEDIPAAIESDIGHLELNGQLRVAELALPPGVSTVQEPDELVAQVVVPRGMEEEEEEAAEGEEVEGEEEAAEGEEGAEAPAAEAEGRSGDEE
ncbi:MAG: 50S ribosomal protein L25 [Acidimicrobiia bacterium]